MKKLRKNKLKKHISNIKLLKKHITINNRSTIPTLKLTNLSIKEKPNYKTKQEYKREALLFLNKNRQYINDPNYKYFVVDIVKGLCNDVQFDVLNDLIKCLQRIKSLKDREGDSEEFEIW
ncbi:hypothetical protein NAPIS_ORF02311 [Vairimorpha apis BRL 01]|uniref:Uncharacterized protein n=1 Tax=Vairimorpha apis BRL 01 TaxID=1037528 RepID=T0L6J3_9MICR|nr:hypothetical protein NAPIS_ORF02311 [Vairimorpha apis BRL 01]